MNNSPGETPLTIDKAIAMLSSGCHNTISEWNRLHASGCQPIAWNSPNIDGRGVTIVDCPCTINLFDLQMKDLYLGQCLKISNGIFSSASFKNVHACSIQLLDCAFTEVRFENLQWGEAEFRNCKFIDCDFSSCNFDNATFAQCLFSSTSPHQGNRYFPTRNKARFNKVSLRGARLTSSKIQGVALASASDLSYLFVDGESVISFASIDQSAVADGLCLAVPPFDSDSRAAFAFIQQRDYWQGLMQSMPVSTFPWRVFWFVSGYGNSLKRLGVMTIFIVLALTCVACLLISYGHIDGCDKAVVAAQDYPRWHILTRSLYFVIVTMTTLGYGDMKPQEGSASGAAFVIVCAAVGYSLFGLFIARVVAASQWPK